MKASSLLIVSVLTVGSLGTQAQAQETSLENFVSSLVEQAVTMTTSELGNNARQLVANASYMFEPDASITNTRVRVTDLAAEKPQEQSQDTSE